MKLPAGPNLGRDQTCTIPILTLAAMILYGDFNMIEQIVRVFLCECLRLQNKARFSVQVSSMDNITCKKPTVLYVDTM